MNGFIEVSPNEMMEVDGGWFFEFLSFYSTCKQIAEGVTTGAQWVARNQPDYSPSAWGINGY